MAGLPFDPDELESRLVWIYGSPRSGSTWLLEQLCDPARLDEEAPAGFTVPSDAAGRPVDVLPVNEFLISTHLAPRGLPSGGLGPDYLLAPEYEEVWRPALRRLILVRLAAVEAAARRSGIELASAPLIAIKEVTGSHAADRVMSLLPRSRLLFLVRDGRDVLDSRLHALSRGGWMDRPRQRVQAESDEQRLSFARDALEEWAQGMDATRAAYERSAEPLRRILHYEDLIDDTRAAIGGTFEWLGLERSGPALEATVERHRFAALPAEAKGARRKRRAARPGLWRENLRPAEVAAAHELIGSRLRDFGYDA
jgi:hypothetical protein